MLRHFSGLLAVNTLHERRRFGFKSWQLWEGLSNPLEGSPVYQYFRRQLVFTSPLLLRSEPFVRPLGNMFGPFVRAGLGLLAPVTLPLAANAYGALLAYSTAAAIYRERERGTYDVLAAAPLGARHVVWSVCYAIVDRLGVPWHINFLRSMAIMGIILLMLPLVTVQGTSLFVLIAVGFGLHLDAIQSVIMGCLCGMLGHEYSQRHFDAGLVGFALFAGAQLLLGYLPAFGAYLLASALLEQTVRGWAAHNLSVAAGLAVLFLLREACIWLLWNALRRLQ